MKIYIHKIIITSVLLSMLIGGLFSCNVLNNSLSFIAAKPHEKQNLIVRNYLYNIGLSKQTELLDMKGSDTIQAIHIGSFDHIDIHNHMLFDQYGNLVSVSGLKDSVSIINFRYDKNGRLNQIIPNLKQFPTLEYDTINITYQNTKPVLMTASKNSEIKWNGEINFDDTNEEYSFNRKVDNKDLFDSYKYKENRLITEYHKTSISDNNIDSIKYIYENNKLVKKTGIFNKSTILKTAYDQLERPIKSTIMFSTKDSIAWTDSYSYQIDDKIPYKIVTSSPLGWEEEIHYQWSR